jgi:hypothetical protein
MFSKVFVINLPFKHDRLENLRGALPRCLSQFEIWPAVHGDSIRHPDWWKAGAGAWGCYRSHLQILEKCYQEKLDSYLVLEDDAIFRPDFEELFLQFMRELPADWEQIYLGGQLLHEQQHPPQKISAHVYIPYNVNRTHALAVSRRGYEKVYKHLNATPFANSEHIDHHWGRLHESGKLKLYCPGKWLVGQDGGPSNISGNNNAATFWVDPEKLTLASTNWQQRYVPAVFLDAPIEIAIELERRGWHRGHWQNAERLDRGVCDALVSNDLQTGLIGWYRAVIPEAVREGKTCVCLHHPNLRWESVEHLPCAPFHRIAPLDAEDAERQLAMIVCQQQTSKSALRPRRNLIYHVWPHKGNGVWQWNVDQLLSRIDQFDGVRSIGVVVDRQSDSLDDVQRAFAKARVDNWIVLPNDPQQGEVATFGNLLDTLPIDNSMTFRAHAKGVRYENPSETRDWTEMMYEICLDDPLHVESALEGYPVCGPFVVESDWPRQGRWHFSGAFFWFRSNCLSKPNAKQVELNYWGVELWPQSLWERSDVGVLFGQTCARLYDGHELKRMRAWLAEWKGLQRKIGAVPINCAAMIDVAATTNHANV